MPTYNSNDYLSLPQQVSKNKGDIAGHETRIVVLENAIIGNTSVVMTDPITIAALGIDYALSVPSANAIKTIATYNYNNPDNYQMFGAQVIIPAAIVNDYITFPDVTDVAYDVVFEIQAKQELNPVTKSYAFIAQGESPEFRFTISFSYRFDIGAYNAGGTPIIRVERLNDQNNLLVVEGSANEFAFTFEQDTTVEGANFTGTITIWGRAGALLPYTLLNTSRVNLIDDDPIKAMTIGSTEMAITGIETVVPNTHNITISLAGHIGLNTMWKVAVQADDERKLTIGDPSDNSHPRVITYDLTTVVTNAISDHTNITTGSPYSASNYIDKRTVQSYYSTISFSTIPIANYTIGTTGGNFTTVDLLIYRLSNQYKYTSRVDATSYLYSNNLTNNTGGNITISDGTNIVITFPDAATATLVQPLTGEVFGHLLISYTGVKEYMHCRLVRAGVTLLVTPLHDGLTPIVIPNLAVVDLVMHFDITY